MPQFGAKWRPKNFLMYHSSKQQLSEELQEVRRKMEEKNQEMDTRRSELESEGHAMAEMEGMVAEESARVDAGYASQGSKEEELRKTRKLLQEEVGNRVGLQEEAAKYEVEIKALKSEPDVVQRWVCFFDQFWRKPGF